MQAMAKSSGPTVQQLPHAVPVLETSVAGISVSGKGYFGRPPPAHKQEAGGGLGGGGVITTQLLRPSAVIVSEPPTTTAGVPGTSVAPLVRAARRLAMEGAAACFLTQQGLHAGRSGTVPEENEWVTDAIYEADSQPETLWGSEQVHMPSKNEISRQPAGPAGTPDVAVGATAAAYMADPEDYYGIAKTDGQSLSSCLAEEDGGGELGVGSAPTRRSFPSESLASWAGSAAYRGSGAGPEDVQRVSAGWLAAATTCCASGYKALVGHASAVP